MALASAKQLLDELMGRDRNLAPAEKKHDLRWEDPEVCKHYLVKFCPNDLFVNTKADLGPCTKIHDDRLKKEYEESVHYQQMGYEDEFLRFCQGMLADVEKRIRRARQRLALGHQEGGIPTPSVLKNNDEKIKVLSERINDLLLQVEQLGCEGKVEEAQGIMKLCEQLQEERETLRKNTEQNHWLQTAEIAAAQEKQMEVCDTCGAFLIVGDAQQRVDDHLMGKQHVGYAKLKAAMDEILLKRDKEREERDQKREKDRAERKRLKEEEDKKREKEREERRKKLEDERRKEAEREREKRKSERGRDRRRSRSRSRSRHGRRSLSRERRRSRSRGRRSTSRERRERSRERRHSYGNMRNRDARRSRRSRSRSEERGRDYRSREQSREWERRDRNVDSKDKDYRKEDHRKHSNTTDENGDASPKRDPGASKDRRRSDSSRDGSRKSSERDNGESDSDQ